MTWINWEVLPLLLDLRMLKWESELVPENRIIGEVIIVVFWSGM
jgi:hypothetical protein